MGHHWGGRTYLRLKSWSLESCRKDCPLGSHQNRVLALEETLVSPMDWVHGPIFPAALQFPWSWAGFRSALHGLAVPQQFRQLLTSCFVSPLLATALLWSLQGQFKKLNQQKAQGRGEWLLLVQFCQQMCSRAGWTRCGCKEGAESTQLRWHGHQHSSSGLCAWLCHGCCVCDDHRAAGAAFSSRDQLEMLRTL